MDKETFAIFATLFLALTGIMRKVIISEDRALRVRWGIGAIIAAALGFLFTGTAISFNYNAWYSSAADKLLKASVEGMEQGRQADVIREWKAMDQKFRWLYGVKGNFREIADDAIKGMNGSPPP